jgi:hypothetical protein
MVNVICIVFLTLFVASLIGYTGYFAFGNSVKNIILYSLPNDDYISITAKIFYIITITGSFVILIQPIFSLIERSKWYINILGN